MYIDNLINKILKIESIKPIIFREPDDPRLDNYFVSLSPNYYMFIFGTCDICENIKIYKYNNIGYDIMTEYGLEKFVCDYGEASDSDIIFELDINKWNGNIDDLVLLLTIVIKNIV